MTELYTIGGDLDEPVRREGVGVRCQGVVHLYRTFEGHDVVALQGVDLEIGAGERVAFLGPSGSGKSTLLALLGGIQKPSAGRIFLGDQEISRLPERQLAGLRSQRVSTMLQGATRNLLPYATARQNIEFARLALPRTARAKAPSDAELLDRVGMAEQRDQVVATMSGGQRQRLALACAVSSGPQLLLADEPTSQLSHSDRDEVIALLHRLGDTFGTTIVVVTHQPEVAETFPRTVTMKGGRVGAEGRDGAEYVVVGAEGVLHLPAHLGAMWPQGTLVRIEPEDADRLLLTRPRDDGTEHPADAADPADVAAPTDDPTDDPARDTLQYGRPTAPRPAAPRPQGEPGDPHASSPRHRAPAEPAHPAAPAPPAPAAPDTPAATPAAPLRPDDDDALFRPPPRRTDDPGSP